MPRAPCALANPEFADVRFTLNAVSFDNLRGLGQEDLRPAYADLLGREHPVAVICDIRDRAAAILRDAGYLATVEVPEQRIAGGEVRFRVLTARLVGLRVRGDAGAAEDMIAAHLNRLTGAEVFNRFEAERYLLLADDLPGYDVRLALRSAGGAPGDVIGEVMVVRRPVEVEAKVQSYGSEDIGPVGALLRAQLYGLTGLGDRTTIALFSTIEFEEQKSIQIGHDFRLGADGLTLSGMFTYAHARPDLGNDTLDFEARTMLSTVEASYPFLRSQADTVRGSIGIDLLDQEVDFNDIPLSRDRLRVIYGRMEAEAIDLASLDRQGGFSPAEPHWRAAAALTLRKGLDIFGASDGCGPAFAACLVPGATLPSRLEGKPDAFVLRGEVYAETRPVPEVTIALGTRGQYAADPLFSFEEFSAGNYTAGRGYDPGTLLGDSGFGFQAELRFGSPYPASPTGLGFQPYVFFDGAWVWNEDLAAFGLGNQDLSSTGAGLRAQLGDWGRLDVALAVPLERAGLQSERGDARLLVSFTTRLLPRSTR